MSLVSELRSLEINKNPYSSNPLKLSPTELVLSDDTDWVPSTMIIDNLGSHFQEFDDSLSEPPRISSKIWFHRTTKALCKKCEEPYLPELDRQRYCDSCRSWYHVRCLINPSPEVDPKDYDKTKHQAIDTVSLGEDGLPEIFDAVLAGPNVRGHGGKYKWDNNWAITGSGVQKGLIAEWKDVGQVPENWLELLGEGFLKNFLVGRCWKFYPCPTCAVNI